MRFLFLIFIFYGAFSVWAQVHTFLNVQVENDFINWWGKGSDRYYTGGNFISVQRIWQNKAVCLIGTELVQKAYTPSNLQAIKVEEMDFPYAGLLFMRNFILISPAQKKWTLLLRISSGTSGPRSGVALFQKRIVGVSFFTDKILHSGFLSIGGLHRWICFLHISMAQ